MALNSGWEAKVFIMLILAFSYILSISRNKNFLMNYMGYIIR